MYRHLTVGILRFAGEVFVQWLTRYIIGVHESIARINKLNGNAFALFLKNQKRWVSKPYEDHVVTEFIKNCKDNSFDTRKSVLPHGSYLINLANPDPEKLQKSKDALLDDLERCEQLGIGLYNLHPGSSLGSDKVKAIKQIGESINEIHAKTKFVKIVLENMTGQDKIVGSNIGDLRDIISHVKDKTRVGVCIDTCHSFCAGYDLRTEKAFNEFWNLFEKTVGYEYLSGIHLNDSKFPFDSKRDVHQNIGWGFLGLEAFRLIMNKKELEGIPLILETPLDNEEGGDSDENNDTRAKEIELLRWLVGKEKDDVEVLEMSIKLQKKGETVREKNQLTVDKKKTTNLKKATKNSKISFTKVKSEEAAYEDEEKVLEEIKVEVKDEVEDQSKESSSNRKRTSKATSAVIPKRPRSRKT